MTLSFVDEVSQTLPAMRAFARSLTRNADAADDLVQDALVRLLTAQQSYTPGTNFKAWAFTVIRNRFYDQYRRKRHADRLQDELMQIDHSHSASQDTMMQLHDMADAFWRLPASFREVLILVGVNEMSYEDAAAVIGCPIGTVRSRLSRARTRLQELMEEGEPLAAGTQRSYKATEAFLAQFGR